MATPHIEAKLGDFGKTVLMPGDPLRAKFAVETFLTDAKLINNVRYVQGYTGYYKGTKVSVMASGMGMPSMGIYSHELYNYFEVENIIRVGSAGAISEKIKLRDIVLGMGACTNSNFAHQFNLPGVFSPIADFKMLSKCIESANELKLPYHVGNLLSSDTFYNDEEGLNEEMKSVNLWKKMGVMAIEMEAAALYMNAARFNKRALAICTVSDHIITGENTSALERERSFTQMLELAFETAVKMEKQND